MKLLYLTSYATPDKVASNALGRQRNEAFIREGWYITFYVPTPCRGISPEIISEYKKKMHRHEQSYDGHMTINRFSMYAEGKNPVLRALRYFFVCIKQYNRAILAKDARDCDVMFSNSTPPIQGAMAAMVSKVRNIPFVYNLQDIFPDSLVGTGMTHEGSFIWKVGRRIEDYTYRHADKIIVISEDFKSNIMAKGVPEEKIEVIYNWVDENAVVPVANDDNPLFDELGISRDKFRVVYAGNLGNAQNIDIIIDAVRRLKNNDHIQFVIFGKGGLEDQIKETKSRENLDNLLVLPLQPIERVSYVYSLGDVCIVACKPGLGGAAMPSKTWSIMSSGSAVLANFDEGELKTIIENNNCGVFTKAGDVDEFVSAIEKLSKNPELCSEMGSNGRQFILKNLTKEVGTQKYVDVIKSVINKV